MTSVSSIGPLPDFLIIGVQKCGTSWLAHLLRQHPEVYISDGEVHFFDKVHNVRKGTDWYRKHFVEAEEHQVVGEKTPDYIWANGDGAEGHDPDVHKNVREVLPDAQLIVLMRNPVDRAISAAKHIIRSGRIPPRYSLDELLVGDKHELIAKHGVLEYGYYHRHLRAYLDLFSRSQILPLFFEKDVVKAPREGFQKVAQFLNISETENIDGIEEKVNAHRMTLLELYAQYYAPRLLGLALRLRSVFPQQIAAPGEKTLARLYNHYAEHNRRLAELMDRPLPESWEAPDAIPASA